MMIGRNTDKFRPALLKLNEHMVVAPAFSRPVMLTTTTLHSAEIQQIKLWLCTLLDSCISVANYFLLNNDAGDSLESVIDLQKPELSIKLSYVS